MQRTPSMQRGIRAARLLGFGFDLQNAEPRRSSIPKRMVHSCCSTFGTSLGPAFVLEVVFAKEQPWPILVPRIAARMDDLASQSLAVARWKTLGYLYRMAGPWPKDRVVVDEDAGGKMSGIIPAKLNTSGRFLHLGTERHTNQAFLMAHITRRWSRPLGEVKDLLNRAK